MEIKIDTSKDSPEEIQKMISFLQAHIEKQKSQDDSISINTERKTESNMNIFNDNNPMSVKDVYGKTENNKEKEEFSLHEELEKKDDDGYDEKIVPY